MKTLKERYTYHFSNSSLIDGLLMKTVVKFVLNKLPMTLTPNKITVFSGACAFSAFALTLQAERGFYHFWLFIPILYYIYLVSDCLDGAQARRTGLFSPIGEFLDHFFDSAVTGYLTGGILITYREQNPFYFFVIMVIGYLTQASSFWERYRTKVMRFGRFSSTETVVFLTAIIFAGCFEPVRRFATTPIYMSFSPLRIFILVSAIFAILNSIFAIVRSHGINWKFLLYIVSASVTALLLNISGYKLETKVIMLTLYEMIYNAKLLVAITMNEEDGLPDFIFPMLLPFLYFVPKFATLEKTICFIYLGFTLIRIVFNNMFSYINEELKDQLRKTIEHQKEKVQKIKDQLDQFPVMGHRSVEQQDPSSPQE